jgi:hypothetical protein
LLSPSTLTNGNRYELINYTTKVVTLSKVHITKLVSAIQKRAEEYFPKNDSAVRNTHPSEEDVCDIVAILKPHYRLGNRNDFTMYLSEWMRKEGIAFESALKVIERIAIDDEEKPARTRTLEETYKKEDMNNICGYSGLLSILVNETQNQDKVKQILEEVKSLFPKTADASKYRKQYKGIKEEEKKSQSQLLIELAHENTSLFFKDQHGTAIQKIST